DRPPAQPDHWAESVRGHRLWQRAASDPTLEAVRARTVTLVAALGETRREGLFRLADDPWQDRELASRITDRAGWLVDWLGEAELSAHEVSRLLAVPFLYDTLWATLAGQERAVAP